MRTGDVLYFSPRFRFSDLDVGDTGKFIEALRDRLMGFYLEPESRLLKTGDACAACRHSRFTCRGKMIMSYLGKVEMSY